MSGFERDALRLQRILEIKAELGECISRNGISREKVLDNRDVRWMVSMPLLDITEQVACLSPDFLERYEIPDFKAVKGMRNRLVHGYGSVDFDYIADAIFDDLPILARACKEILDELGGQPPLP